MWTMSRSQSLDLAYELVRQSVHQAQIRSDRLLGIGMGIAAPVDSATGAVQSEGILPGWHGIRPAEEMQGRLGLPVQVDNDANLGALGEREFGCGQGVRNMIYIRLSTGVGAGLILDGRAVRRFHGDRRRDRSLSPQGRRGDLPMWQSRLPGDCC